MGVGAETDVVTVMIVTCVSGERHQRWIGDLDVVGKGANSKLSPAVIPEVVAIGNLCFSVESLAELRNEKKGAVSDIFYIDKQLQFTLVPVQPCPSQLCEQGSSDMLGIRVGSGTDKVDLRWPGSSR